MTAKLTLTTEEILEEAEICYANCKVLVSTLATACKELDEKFDKDNAMVQFDLLLQSLLFSQALADGEFAEEEKEFIRKISKENNLFDYIIVEEGQSITMEDVFALDIEKQTIIAEAINNSMNQFADDFIIPFAMLDAVTTTNVLFDLSSDLSNMSILLSAVDGEITEDELETFTDYCDQLIIGKWQDIKGITEDLLAEAVPSEEASEETEEE